MPEVHAKVSSSKAFQWGPCPPSLAFEAKFPNRTSEAAEEGTLAHSVAEAILRFKSGMIFQEDYEDELKRLKKHRLFSEDMFNDCTNYANKILNTLEDVKKVCPDATLVVEQRVNLTRWIPEGFGTTDAAIIAEPYLHVFDFKYGKGHRVNAEGNPQMRLYALGTYDAFSLLFNIECVSMTIIQPRISNGTTTDEIEVQDLLTWGEEYIKPRALLAYNGEGEYNPSEETCKFCRARGCCKARADKFLELFDDNSPLPSRSELSVEEASEILTKADGMRAWLTDLEEFLYSKLMSGEKVPGYKLVEGRSIRKITNTDAVIDLLLSNGCEESAIYKPRELITLTQMEKDFGKKWLNELIGTFIEKPKGKPTMAPESDRRPAIDLDEDLLNLFDD